MSHFFAYLSKMRYVRRWNVMRNTQYENILEHSAQCAMIAHCLCVIKNVYFGGDIDADGVAVLALYHEAGEVITGDLATPIKYFNPQIKSAYKSIEGIAAGRLLNMLPNGLKDEFAPLLCQGGPAGERAVIKAADKICAYIKCVEELKAGNQEFLKAKDKIEADIKAIDLPEVKYFMDNFIASFELTLDELN